MSLIVKFEFASYRCMCALLRQGWDPRGILLRGPVSAYRIHHPPPVKVCMSHPLRRTRNEDDSGGDAWSLTAMAISCRLYLEQQVHNPKASVHEQAAQPEAERHPLRVAQKRTSRQPAMQLTEMQSKEEVIAETDFIGFPNDTVDNAYPGHPHAW